MDNSGNMYVCDDGVGTRVYKVTPGGAITVIAGNGTSGFSGDGGPATSAQLFEARAVAVDAAGNVYIADTGNLRVRKVDPPASLPRSPAVRTRRRTKWTWRASHRRQRRRVGRGCRFIRQPRHLWRNCGHKVTGLSGSDNASRARHRQWSH